LLGEGEGESDGDADGLPDGDAVGVSVAAAVSDGVQDGDAVGVCVSVAVAVADIDGLPVDVGVIELEADTDTVRIDVCVHDGVGAGVPVTGTKPCTRIASLLVSPDCGWMSVIPLSGTRCSANASHGPEAISSQPNAVWAGSLAFSSATEKG
jgi:hypothetical protein